MNGWIVVSVLICYWVHFFFENTYWLSTLFQDNLSRDSQRPADARPDSANNDSISAFNDIIYETTLRSGNLEETTELIAQILQNCSGDQVLSSILHVVDTLFEKVDNWKKFQEKVKHV